jgi:hypothetical protein
MLSVGITHLTQKMKLHSWKNPTLKGRILVPANHSITKSTRCGVDALHQTQPQAGWVKTEAVGHAGK